LFVPDFSDRKEITPMEEKHSEGFEDTGYKVVARVISQKGTCGFGHKVGDTVDSFLPKVFAMRYGADFPWLKDDKDMATHACPDGYNPVVFEIRRVRE